jgi:branched-chain amino acid aminotransferase
MSLVWINGTLVDKADARVSPFDHGFLYGDGVWEHLRVFGGQLFRPADGLFSLYTAAHNLGIDIPLSREELTTAMEATVRANNRTEGYVRVIVTRGVGTIGPDPRKLDPQVIIIAEEYQPFPLELCEHGLHVVTAQACLDLSNPVHFHRVLGRPHVVLAKQHALRNGCLEAIFLTANGSVRGCTEGALFLVQSGVVKALPSYPLDATWMAVVDLAREAGPLVPESTATRDDLLAADEVFLAGTSCGVIGIVRVDGRDIGPGTEGPVTKQIRHAYRRLTRGE